MNFIFIIESSSFISTENVVVSSFYKSIFDRRSKVDNIYVTSAMQCGLLCQQSLVFDGNDPDSSFLLTSCTVFFKSHADTNRECSILSWYNFVSNHTINNACIYVKYSLLFLWNCHTGCG